jgi:hypothetical protein
MTCHRTDNRVSVILLNILIVLIVKEIPSQIAQALHPHPYRYRPAPSCAANYCQHTLVPMARAPSILAYQSLTLIY